MSLESKIMELRESGKSQELVVIAPALKEIFVQMMVGEALSGETSGEEKILAKLITVMDSLTSNEEITTRASGPHGLPSQRAKQARLQKL
jgi:hypothetical protein